VKFSRVSIHRGAPHWITARLLRFSLEPSPLPSPSVLGEGEVSRYRCMAIAAIVHRDQFDCILI
jgi:hypothetical protein